MSIADPWELLGNFAGWLRTPLRRYSFAIVAVAIATLIRVGLRPSLGPLQTFTPFYPAILLIALEAGFWPSVFGSVLSGALAEYVLLRSGGQFQINDTQHATALFLFALVSLTISAIAERERRRASRLQEFERVIQGLDEMIVVVDRDYRYLIANGAFLKYRDMRPDQVIGHRVDEVVDPEVFRSTVKPKMDEAFQGKVVRYEMRYEYLAGAPRDILVSYFPIQGHDGIDRLAGILRDVTEKKRAAEALQESEDRYRDLVEHSEDLVCTHDLAGNLLSLNPTPARILGYEVAELLNRPMHGLIAPEYRDHFEEYLTRIKDKGQDRGILCVLTRTGERRLWRYSNTLRTEGVEQPIVRGMARDITEQRRAEANLQRSEQRYRSLFEKNIAAVAISTMEGQLLDCNDAFAAMLGFESAAEIRGRSTTDFYLVKDERQSVIEDLRQDGAFFSRELQIRRKDGTGIWVLFNCVLRHDENGELIIQSTGINITKRRETEAALRKSEEHFRILVEQASDGIFMANAEGRYIDVNSAGANMLGYTQEEVLQRSIAEVIAQEEIPRIASEVARFANGRTVLSEWKFRRKDGSFFPGEVCGRQLADGRLQGIVRDITERKLAEEAQRQNEERFRVALKDSPISVFNQDRDLRYTWVYNPHVYWHTEILGKTDEEILGAKQAARLTEMKLRVLSTGQAAREEVSIAHNETTYALDMAIEPLFDSDQRIVGITGASMDIARLRQLADRLQEDKDKLAQEKLYLEKEIETELGFEQIVGHSPALREVLKKVRVVAPTDSTVLLLGETGTGKELVARSVHSLSLRNERNFVKLNCAAVPSGLLESELFGHEKGAFTGAVSQKIGRIELADKGTLFLDEIGELPIELQPKLLRVLQDREFERLGGIRTVHVDVRIIAATNRDLWKDIADKTFREDLFYRLNVFPIHLPSLRERRSDIRVLIQHFVTKYAARMGKHITAIPDETLEVLQNWNWPGNVRELENIIERMVILTKGNVLAPAPAELEMPEEVEGDSLRDMEREHILRVLRETHGVLSGVEGAADRLGMKRTTLQSKMKRLGIGAHDYRNGRNHH